MSDSLLDDLLEDSQTKYLKETCPSLFNNGVPNFSYNNILSRDQEYVIPDGLKYYQMVETGNSYVNDLLNEEEKYLKKKYGESLYNYFVTKREKYINDKMKSVCSTIVSNGGITTDDGTTVVDNTPLIVALRRQLDSYEQSLRTYNEISKNKEQMKDLNMLDSRKFYYQSNAIEDVNNVDMVMSAIYYVILVICIIHLTLKDGINIREKWWIYILLVLLPMILSKIYSFIVIRLFEIRDFASEQVPKNAFLNRN